MISIHPIHRKMAQVVHMNLDQNGSLIVGNVELQLILMLLRLNHDLVYKLDALKELALHAYEMGDMDWQMDICKQIEELEAQLI